MFDVALRNRSRMALLSLLSRERSRGERGISPRIHPKDESHHHYDGPCISCDCVTVQHHRPEPRHQKKAFPRIAGRPCQQSYKLVQRQEKRMRICEHARDLRWCSSKQWRFLVYQYSGAQFALRCSLAQGGGREGGIGRRIRIGGGLRRRIICGARGSGHVV